MGRERLGLKSSRKRGFGPLDRWVEALETGGSSSKEEDKGGGNGEEGSLGPGVQEMTRKFESGAKGPECQEGKVGARTLVPQKRGNGLEPTQDRTGSSHKNLSAEDPLGPGQ